MVDQKDVTKLTQDLQSLRGTIVREGTQLDQRVQRLLQDHEAAAGTDYEPALASVQSLPGCIQRGLEAKDGLPGRLRPTG